MAEVVYGREVEENREFKIKDIKKEYSYRWEGKGNSCQPNVSRYECQENANKSKIKKSISKRSS